MFCIFFPQNVKTMSKYYIKCHILLLLLPIILRKQQPTIWKNSTFSTNDVPNNISSRPDANSTDLDQTAHLEAKSLQINKC